MDSLAGNWKVESNALLAKSNLLLQKSILEIVDTTVHTVYTVYKQ
jgi:hypothetical protein